ncbi:AAA family ATPase [Pseudomonas sp. 3A(2025)]
MRLDHLHLQNFRCYEDAHFDFQPGFNLVVGVNGSGKTSLLKGVAASFKDFMEALGIHGSALSETDVRFSIVDFDGQFRFERFYPIKLEAQGEAFDFPAWSLSLERNSAGQPVSVPISIKTQQKLNSLDPSQPTDLAIVAFYQANRRWSTDEAYLQQAALEKPSRLDAYKQWFDAAANFKYFESWLVGKTLERLQKISRKPSIDKFNDELEWLNSAIQCALPFKSIEYDMDLRSLIVNLEDKTIPFNDLSDGQRGIIALFADIARRIFLLNPHLGKEALVDTTGVIIIDELDIHLHPGWQRSIAPALQKAFPKIQFIAASHSPQIIGSLKPDQVILLHNTKGSHPRVTYGLDSSSVLEDVMDVAQRAPEIEELLNELFSTLEDNGLEQARKKLQALKEIAPDLPEFAGAEALIRRKEIINR